MLIKREITHEFKTLLGEYPVVTILGPRQAGKTTLARTSLPDYAYINLENPETREFAEADPKAFLSQYPGKTIFDEIQRTPTLLSYIQVIVDEEKTNGRFVLTGSHQLSLREAIGQSLAGRTSILQLLPLSIYELENTGISFEGFAEYAFHGFLPRVHEQPQRPSTAYANYYSTYVERDVRQLIQLRDASLFEKMLKLVAGRAGQIMDVNSLANDVGVDNKTIAHWLSILEASFILFKLPPYHENFGKRIIKRPKYYFTDVGLLCYLLGIQTPSQITRDPLVGSIFENLIVIECLKQRYNQGQPADLYFFRDSNGNEVDLILENGRQIRAAEIKSASTFSIKQLKGLRRFQSITDQIDCTYLIYNGTPKNLSDNTTVLNFKQARALCDQKH